MNTRVTPRYDAARLLSDGIDIAVGGSRGSRFVSTLDSNTTGPTLDSNTVDQVGRAEPRAVTATTSESDSERSIASGASR